jgi:hypothetical protein
MCFIKKKYSSSLNHLVFPVLLFIYATAYPQNQSENERIVIISLGRFSHIIDSIYAYSEDSTQRDLNSLMPAKAFKNKTNLLLDSLKTKASKNLVTKKLYDFLIVSNYPGNKNHITGTSDITFLSHSGKRIRKIDIQRLNVFGANVETPSYLNQNKIENLLSKTHFNTNEIIIRKNLLFSEGDTIFPLVMSDNERILRQLSFIDDARIVVVPISDDEADIIVVTKDVYSLGANFHYNSLNKGTASIFEKNLFGMGHELGLDIPYDKKFPDSPGFGSYYVVNNISKTFSNLHFFFNTGLGKTSYGFNITRDLVSATTKYAGAISVSHMSTSEDLDSLLVPEPLKYNLQDYWLSRSFLINKESVSRIILGFRYTNNNVFDKPFILPFSYYNLQRYKTFLGSAALSVQKYYKTNLIYGYGRTEDIPCGGLLRLTAGKEINEFKERTYLGADVSFGKSTNYLGYFYVSAGLGAFTNWKGNGNGKETEQGILSLEMNFFSNLIGCRRSLIRNFIDLSYTRGFGRYTDEYLKFIHENGFSGFKNDSISGTQRFTVSLESVVFSPANFYGFRFAFFGFADISFMAGTNQLIGNGNVLSGIGLGLRIRNNNLVFNTLQIRLGFFPNLPSYSNIDHLVVSGEQLLRPKTFDPGPPSLIPFR